MRYFTLGIPKIAAVCILCCGIQTETPAQVKTKKARQEPITLFSVGNAPVSADEFIYLYRKNHQHKETDYTREKIDEYLKLYINFKLKVREAMSRGMDTTTTFVTEFNSYKDELRKPYLPDAHLTDSLVRLTYDRMRDEVNASHILVTVALEAPPEDTLKAYEQAIRIRNEVVNGKDFGEAAVAYSDDPSAKANRGSLGYFTALQMVFPFETAAYETKPGDVSMPVRTKFGYHVIRVNDRRTSRGEVEVSHIMIRTEGAKDDQTRNRIFTIYDQLQGGMNWDEACRQYSEDQATRANGGRLRPIRPGAMAAIPEFETMAFSLKHPGDISDPVQTQFGWHLIRLERQIPVPSFEEAEAGLKSRVVRDDRTSISRAALMDGLRRDYQLRESQEVKEAALALADSSLQRGAWSPSKASSVREQVLFDLDTRQHLAGEFLDYAQKKQRPNAEIPYKYLSRLYDEFVDACILARLEGKILSENPSYRYLLNEYYEGILLFEIMEKEVWNKASTDTTALRTYYEGHLGRYTAPERVEAVIYASSANGWQKSLIELVEGGKQGEIQQFVSAGKIGQESGIFERQDKVIFQNVPWEPGVYTSENSGMYYLAWLKAIRPPGPMSFDESRPTIITDYQAFLEENWLAQLKGKYTVKVNDKGKKYMLAKLLGK
jgi:peptidyl-prolyl cis-trans isomerase SurA